LNEKAHERLMATSLISNNEGKLIPSDVNTYLRRQMIMTPTKNQFKNNVTRVNNYSLQQMQPEKLHYPIKPYTDNQIISGTL
jgi:hypothetical protein